MQRGQQPVVVARVQADRRLVENVQHADQAAADLPGQANALRLAAGQRRRRAVEREIFEPHVAQEAEPAANFLEHFGGDQSAAVASSSSSLKNSTASLTASAQTSGSERGRLDRRNADDACVIVTARACGFSRCAIARGAAHHLHVLFELPQLHLALRVAVLVEQRGNDALEPAAILLARRRLAAR